MKKDYRILVADDSLEVRNALYKILIGKYDVDFASTPEKAINYNEKFDLLLTDFYFGENKKRGLEVIGELKKKKKDLSAILMSLRLSQNIKSKCKKLKIPTFLKYEDNITPINEDKLRELIKSYLK